MRKFQLLGWLLFVAVTCSTFGLPATGTQHPHESPIDGYRNWKRINSKPIYMLPSLAALCIGPISWDADRSNPHVPHYFNVYVNQLGQSAMMSGKSSRFPVGSVIAKEKFAGQSAKKVKLITVMVKRSLGYDRANGDWEYLTFDGDLSRSSSFNKKLCQSCHATQKLNDFVYRNYVSPYAQSNPKSLRGSYGRLSPQLIKNLYP